MAKLEEAPPIPIPFSAGADTGVDPKLLPAPYLLRAENVEIIKRGTLQKRSKLTALATAILGTSDLMNDVRSLRVYGTELLASLADFVYSFSSSASKWVMKGSFVPVTIKTTDVIKNTYEQAYPDMAVSGNTAIYAWEDSRGGIRAAIRDLVTGVSAIPDYEIPASSSMTRPRCLKVSTVTNPVIFTADSNFLTGYVVNAAALTIGSAVQIKSDLKAASPHFDVIDIGGSIACVYNVTGGSSIRFITIDPATLVATNRGLIAEAADSSIAIVAASDFVSNVYYYIFWYDGTNLRCSIYSGSYTILVAPFTVVTDPAITKVTGVYANYPPTSVRVFYEVGNVTRWKDVVRTLLITSGGAVSSPVDVARSVTLVSRAFNKNGASGAFAGSSSGTGGGSGVVAPVVDGYVICRHETDLQNTYFMIRNDGTIAARFQYGRAGGVAKKSVVCSCGIWNYASGLIRLLFALPTTNTRKTADNFSFLSYDGVSQVQVDFNDQQAFDGVQAGAEMIVVGGRVSSYDGQGITEQGFHLFPENMTISETTAGSLTALGTYGYAVVYEWTDGNGRLHRSAPGFISITLTGANNKTSLVIPTLALTARHAAATPARTAVQIIIYRTEANGSVYYLSGSTTPTYNTIGSDTVTITDDIADSTLIGREPLYTTGGELENIGAPTAKFIAIFGKRVILAGTEDNTIWPSKQFTEGKPIEFSDLLVITPSTLGGDITGIKTLDDKFLFFREHRIEYITGEGPNNLGTGTPFSPPTEISNDVGCINARSLVEFPGGIIFQSRKGFYLLNRALQLFYIGQQVKQWETATVARAVSLQTKNQIRITLTGDASGTALVLRYDMAGGNPQFDWTIFTSYGAKDAVISNSTFYMVDSTGAIYQESEGSFSSTVALAVTTPWISLDSLEGFKRIKEILLLMTYKSAHVLTVKIGYDYSPAWSQTLTFNPSSAAGIVAVADSDYYGIGSFSGDARAPYQLRICPAIQKCAAIRLQISDGTLSGTNEGLSLSGMVLRVATKRGLNKLRAAQSI